jgi:hypothetical protein
MARKEASVNGFVLALLVMAVCFYIAWRYDLDISKPEYQYP